MVLLDGMLFGERVPSKQRVVREITTLLAHLDHEGHTLTHGVTSIDATPPAPVAALPAPAARAQAGTTALR